MMRLVIRLIRTHMKIIFNRYNAIFYSFRICFKIHICLSMLICLLLIAGGWTKMVDGGTRMRRGWRRGGGGGEPVGWRRRCSRMTLYNSRWSSRPLSMWRIRTTTMTMLSRTPLGLTPQVQHTSTCEFRESPSAADTSLIGARLFDPMGKGM
jgi:hypothetical protein